MRAYRLTVDQTELFFEICQRLNANTEPERVQILETMAEYGQIESITKTSMSKDEYIQHLANKFGNVLKINKTEGSISPQPGNDLPKGDL